MKNLLLLFLLACFTPLQAQQNLFNIPSGDITPKGKLFYQHQLNLYAFTEFESKSHLVGGLGRGWDAGLNLVDLPLDVRHPRVVSINDNRSRKPLYPLLMATLQKQWEPSEKLKLNIGTQAGTNLSSNTRNKKFAYFNYALLRGRVLSRINWVLGAYHTNNTFVGKERQHFGAMVGYEIPLSDRFSLMGDFISGRHKKAQTTIGGFYTLNKRVQLCMAALLDYPHGQKNHGVVLELNVFGWDLPMTH